MKNTYVSSSGAVYVIFTVFPCINEISSPLVLKSSNPEISDFLATLIFVMLHKLSVALSVTFLVPVSPLSIDAVIGVLSPVFDKYIELVALFPWLSSA